MSSDEKKPKKRGRKPKNITVSKKKDSKDDVKIPENLIIRLQSTKIEENNIKPYEKENLMNINKNDINTSEVCWNCCHPFHNLIYGIPLKYVNKVFYTYGDFCSLECAGRHAFDHLKDFDFSEIHSLINLYNNILFNSTEKVELAPNRLLLKLFGGPHTIDEYRDNFKKKNVYDIKIPPIYPINHIIDTYETNTNTHLSNLKLYRKKPLPSEKKSITSSMNLIIENNDNDDNDN